MSIQCSQCGKESHRYRHKFDAKLGKVVDPIGVDCGCSGVDRSAMAKSAFDITFDHVKDENGKNLHVSNIRELERAEKKYDFQAQVLHANQSNYDAPLKRLEQPTVNALYKRKFGRG